MDDDSLRDYGPAAPHGPNMDRRHSATSNIRDEMSRNEHLIFSSLLLPDDIYTDDGTYWADLPLKQRISFVNKVDKAEAKEELTSLWNMFKKDPLSPIGWYARNMVLPGAGLLLEGWVVSPCLQSGGFLTIRADMCSSPSATSSPSSRPSSPRVGRPMTSATRRGRKPSSTSKSSVSSLVSIRLLQNNFYRNLTGCRPNSGRYLG